MTGICAATAAILSSWRVQPPFPSRREPVSGVSANAVFSKDRCLPGGLQKGVYLPMALDRGSRKMTFVLWCRGRKFTSCVTAPGVKCAQNANHRFGRSIKRHWVHLHLVHTRVIFPSGPIPKEGRSPWGGGTALVGSTASQERGNAAMQHSGVSLTLPMALWAA